jgi:quinol monooxygenase YgiN
MSTLYVRHKVGDYTHWKSGYDAFAPTREALGVTAASVHRDIGDPDTLIIMHQFGDTESMLKFANSNELHSAMEGAGVVGAPEIWLSEDIETTSH